MAFIGGRPRTRPALRSLSLLVAILVLGTAASRRLAAEELWSQSGFFVDMPAGFRLSDGDGKSRFAFVDPKEGMEFDLRAYEPDRYGDVQAMAADILVKLGSKGDEETFSYEGRPAVMAELSFQLNGGRMKGYGILIAGRAVSGSATPQAEKSYALLAYTDESRFEAYSDFILSCLDAFSIDRAARRSPGPLSQYVLAWPPDRGETRKVALPGGEAAELPWSKEEAQQEADTTNREYKVLQAYKDSEDYWVDAWARFYRMVYRESAARLDRLVLEFSKSLPADDPTESARRVLAWVQGFVYEQDQVGIDFFPPLTAAFEERGDCDSRAVVMAIIMKRLGIDTVLMLSREYSHAMVAVDVPGGGQRFAYNGKSYLVAETTAKVGLGMIAASQADFSKWLGVELGP